MTRPPAMNCAIGHHTRCAGCACPCHPAGRTFPLALAITLVLAVLLLVGIAWASR